MDRVLSGSRWKWKALLLVLVISLFRACPAYDALATDHARATWRTMQFQTGNLPVDMGRLYPPDSHESKLTFRLTVPIMARVLHLGEPGLLILYGIAGIAVLYMVLALSHKITGSQRAAFFVCLAVACTWPGETSFHEFYGGVYDGIALCFLLLALSTESALLAGAAVFLAAWTEERALIASAFLLLFWFNAGSRGRNRMIALLAAWTGYIAVRLILTNSFSLTVATGNVGLPVLQGHIALIPVGIWTGLGGAWIIVGCSLIALFRQRRYWLAAGFCGLLGLTIIGAFLVMDVTRTMAYCLPAVFVALSVLMRCEPAKNLDKLAKIGAAASVLAPTFFVLGNTLLYLYPLPLQAIRWLRH
jgi:hypothetical protein